MPLLIAICAAVSVSLLLIALLSRREDVFRERLRSISTYDPDDNQPNFSLPFLERVLYPLTEGFVDRAVSLMPPGLATRMNQRLVVAGDPMPFRRFVLLWAGIIFLFAAGGLFVLVSMGFWGSPMGLAGLLLVVVIAAVLPYSFVNTAAKRRKKVILKSMPDAMDLVTTSVEAGLGLDAALGKVAEKADNPLSVELGRALREMALGRSRRDALEDMANRTEVEELQTFVGAVIQAEQLGVSLAQVLRIQSDQLRVRRRQRAQEAAMQAPIKMVFPLVFGVFPTLMLVIIGPAVVTVIKNGGLGG